jgi:hypothetical protein
MAKLLKRIDVSILTLILWGIWSAPASAEGPIVAHVYFAQGAVEARSPGQGDWHSVPLGAPLHEGDSVRTGGDGQAAFKCVDGVLVRLGRLSALTFNSVEGSQRPEITMVAHSSSHAAHGRNLRLKHPSLPPRSTAPNSSWT